jgi:hypothetical protein
MAPKIDNRAKLTPKGGYSLPFGGPGAALQRTKGLMFPYTPNISVSHQVDYSRFDLVHTNYQQNSYSMTRNPDIQVTGTFVSQTPEEAAYTVGAIHFLRVMSKMNFGINDDDRGTPPPVCLFSAYGAYNFAKVPVLIGGFQFVYEDGVDYVTVVTAGQTVQIPVLMTISITLLAQYSPEKQNDFSLAKFASGEGYSEGFL